MAHSVHFYRWKFDFDEYVKFYFSHGIHDYHLNHWMEHHLWRISLPCMSKSSKVQNWPAIVPTNMIPFITTQAGQHGIRLKISPFTRIQSHHHHQNTFVKRNMEPGQFQASKFLTKDKVKVLNKFQFVKKLKIKNQKIYLEREWPSRVEKCFLRNAQKESVL